MSELTPATEKDLRDKEGAPRVIEWFGRWPTFHDSYLLDLHFSIWERSFIRLHVYRTFHGTSNSEAIVTIFFGGLLRSEVRGLTDQLLGITIYRSSENFVVEIEGAYELTGTIGAADISFDLCPWPPEERNPDGGSRI